METIPIPEVGNVDVSEKKHIFVATPMYGGTMLWLLYPRLSSVPKARSEPRHRPELLIPL
jgi:hypothetical protein